MHQEEYSEFPPELRLEFRVRNYWLFFRRRAATHHYGGLEHGIYLPLGEAMRTL
jgi:hypothetical protein